VFLAAIMPTNGQTFFSSFPPTVREDSQDLVHRSSLVPCPSPEPDQGFCLH
jgi:hypothetical protein